MNQKFLSSLVKLQSYIFFEFLGGPRPMDMRVPVNIFKGATFFYIIFLMWYYSNYSFNMYVYLALHGSYGWAWLFKDVFFGDKTFQTPATVGSLVGCTFLLLMYWSMPWYIATGVAIQTPSFQRFGVSIFLYVVGVVLMIGSDAHKTFTLKYRKGLIDDGLFERTRNPNYLGEVMLYGAFAVLTGYWASYCVVMFVWLTLFVLNMTVKDFQSLRKKTGWDSYQKKSYLFLPRVFHSHLANLLLYGGLIAVCVLKYYHIGTRAPHPVGNTGGKCPFSSMSS